MAAVGMNLRPLRRTQILPGTATGRGSSPASATIKEPGIDTKSVPGLFFFMQTFTPKRGIFSNFATHFDFRCPPLVRLPTPRIAKPLHIALLICKIPQFVKRLSF